MSSRPLSFAPDGQLSQISAATRASERGFASAALITQTGVIVGTAQRLNAELEDVSYTQKISLIDEKILLAFSGLTADGRVLVDKAREKSQIFRLTYADEPSCSYLSDQVARVMQKFTQSGGVRPFGVAALICGLDKDIPKLYLVSAHGVLSEWKATAIGRRCKNVKDYFEKNFEDDLTLEKGIEIMIGAMTKVTNTSANIGCAYIDVERGVTFLEDEEIAEIAKKFDENENEKEEEEEEEEAVASTVDDEEN
ncbi:hypothetical protein PCE1_003050 [Barthelona sp. PCE]